MLRQVFTVTSALSLLLCAASVVLWVRSYWTGDGFTWNYLVQRDAPEADLGHADHYRVFGFSTGKGGFHVRREEQYPILGANWPPLNVDSKPRADLRPLGGTFGFDYEAETFATYIYFPAWSAVLLTALLPGLWLALLRRRRRRMGFAANSCQVCGYDLRTSPDRCPECGTPISRAST